ncbi:predicted protein [Naegleria gruberi]|uniref:Predicted protein n=1 Tax=Naegleria gruberi TaxID=5762 RepID=D2V4K1_NAEGR|nr:uncharacterized protein NAEGRDRAFT_63758 [Naegleria gruberi]EFC48528.1 predicted protein [Naegleria gruberi]|eukprot:XP_002681272.1 predicted protein [Naegleria gruberi strain NEG-M]
MDTNNNPATTATTSSWKVGHAVLQIVHIVWLVLQLIYHMAMMISYYRNSIPGYATADLILVLVCFFFLAMAAMGLVALFMPESRLTPVIASRMVKLNTMAYVLGMQYFTFIYLLLWVTGK